MNHQALCTVCQKEYEGADARLTIEVRVEKTGISNGMVFCLDCGKKLLGMDQSEVAAALTDTVHSLLAGTVPVKLYPREVLIREICASLELKPMITEAIVERIFGEPGGLLIPANKPFRNRDHAVAYVLYHLKHLAD